MKVRCTAERPLLMFISAPAEERGGVYRVDPGEEFEVPDGTALPPGIERVAAPPEVAQESASGEGDK